ncbi:MAG: ROK family transcriptional regulator [Dermatophilaceae bacterium]
MSALSAAPRGGAPGGAARQDDLRRHNLGVVLRTVADAADPPSRADVAARTGLTRGTASVLVEQLLELGLVEQLSPVATRRAGRPSVPIRLARGSWVGVGVEVGVTSLAVRVVDLARDVLVDRVHAGDLRGRAPAEVLDRVAALAGDAVVHCRARGARVVGAAVALPGLVDAGERVLRTAPNLDWNDIDLRPLLDAPPFAGLPITLCGNEAQLAARAELSGTPGAGRPADFVLVSGEVGIGGALVIDGQVLAHGRGWAGEVGHTTVDPSGRACRCGARGCLEAYAGRGTVMTAAGLDVLDPVERLLDLLAASDRRAGRAVQDAGRALGLALAQVANVVDVQEMRLGGFLAALHPWLEQPVLEQLAAHVVAAPWSRHRVVAATAGPGAALTGAVLTVLDRLLADPLAFTGR